MSVQTLPPDVTLYEDTYIDLICDPNIPEAVDTEVDISFTWTGAEGNGNSIDIGEEGYTVTDQPDNSTFRIETLDINRDDMAVYSCSVRVTPKPGSVYIRGIQSNTGSITLSVNGELHIKCNMFRILLRVW